MYSCGAKLHFKQPLLQSLVSHDHQKSIYYKVFINININIY